MGIVEILITSSLLLSLLIAVLSLFDFQIESLQKEIIEWRMRYDALENSNAIQREELNTLRVDNYQLSLFFHHSASANIVEIVKIDPRDIQLKHQFEEKSDLLHETRKSLFYMENNFLALQREQKESFLELPFQENLFMHQLNEVESICVALEAEIAALHEVIKALIAPKKVSKPKKQELFQTSFI